MKPKKASPDGNPLGPLILANSEATGLDARDGARCPNCGKTIPEAPWYEAGNSDICGGVSRTDSPPATETGVLPARLTGLKAEFGLTRKGVPPIG